MKHLRKLDEIRENISCSRLICVMNCDAEDRGRIFLLNAPMTYNGSPSRTKKEQAGDFSVAKSIPTTTSKSVRPAFRVPSEPPPGECTKVYQGPEMDALRLKALRPLSEPPPCDRTQVYKGPELDALRSKALRLPSEPPPGERTRVFKGPELDDLRSKSLRPRMEQPFRDQTHEAPETAFSVSRSRRSIHPASEPPLSERTRAYRPSELNRVASVATKSSHPAAIEEDPHSSVTEIPPGGSPRTAVNQREAYEDDNERTRAYIRSERPDSRGNSYQESLAPGGMAARLIDMLEREERTVQAIPKSFVDEKSGERPSLTKDVHKKESRSTNAEVSEPSANQVTLPPGLRKSRRSGTTLVVCSLVVAMGLGLYVATKSHSIAPRVRAFVTRIENRYVRKPVAPTKALPEKKFAVVDVTVTPPEAQVFLDGRSVSNPLKATLTQDSLEHELRSEAPGYQTKTQRFRIDGNVLIVLDLEKIPDVNP